MKYLFRAANVWWRCAQYFVICLEAIDVCIWRMFVFMSVVVTVWECLLSSVLLYAYTKTNKYDMSPHRLAYGLR